MRRNASLRDSQGRFKGAAGLFIALGLLASLLPAGLADAQTRRTRPRRVSTPFAQTTPTPTPSPIVVPQLPPAQRTQTPPTTAPQQQPPQQRPTPAPTPEAKPGEALADDDDVVRVTSNLVVVPVSVVDAKGEAVQGLTREDFRLEEDGRAQELASLGNADQVPLDIAILIDTSSSVKERFDFEKQTAAGFLKTVLRPGDKAAVYAIGDKPGFVQALATADEAGGKLLAIPPPPEHRFTAYFDTVIEAARYLDKNAPGNHRRVIVALTDGDDTARILAASLVDSQGKQINMLNESQQQVLREVQRADAVFYSINPSGQTMHLNVRTARSQEGMQQLAAATGGNAFVPTRLEDLPAVFRQIANELRAQYLIQYQSNGEAQPGKFIKINVTTPARAGLTIRARQGYYKK
ncbi:MAG TPA: VWA domain-containing protein [Pyrinomonadaceae bacterium]